MKYFLASLMIIALASCQEPFDDDFTGINPDLMPYIESFVEEANKRGVSVDISTLNAELRPISDFGQSKRNHVLIDEKFFRSYEGYATQIEIIVFHELGHNRLNLGHADESKYIMSTPTDITLYKAITREKALDNLFTLGK